MIDPARPSQKGLCANCRYPLRGLPEPRCPECGQEFDPGDPRTFYVPGQQPVGPITRWLAKPPGRVFLVASAASASLGFLSGFAPGLISALALFSSLSFLILALVWCAKLVALSNVRSQSKLPAVDKKAVRSWALPPAIFALAAFLFALDVPLYLGFAIHKPSLDRLVSAASTTPTASFYGQIGRLYEPSYVLKVGPGVRIDFGADGGFGYFPKGPPRGSVMIVYKRVWGDWYAWRWWSCGWDPNPFLIGTLPP